MNASIAEIVEANQIYGALSEGLYLTGLSFEGAMGNVFTLLKSGLWTQVGTGFDDVNAFVRSLQLDKFKVVAEQRKEFAKLIKDLQPKISNRAIGDAFGVAHTSISRPGANAPPEPEETGENGEPAGANAPPSTAPPPPPPSASGAAGGQRAARLITSRETARGEARAPR